MLGTLLAVHWDLTLGRGRTVRARGARTSSSLAFARSAQALVRAEEKESGAIITLFAVWTLESEREGQV